MKSKRSKDFIENAEYGLDSRYRSKKEHESEAASLMEARLTRMKNLSKSQIKRAKLMQLKLKMEEYLKQNEFDNKNHFTDFLKAYVDIIYPTRYEFANDINISHIRLSQVINNHRKPKDEFIMKLMIHSENVFKNICNFQKKIWFEVYYHEKLCITMSSQEEWRTKLEKDIKFSGTI